ncbi:MAG: GGDEF domain-containing protein [Butyrivibrio sp.]|nr:GGDEF domain-containing protein [Butyrivibrio sp.]
MKNVTKEILIQISSLLVNPVFLIQQQHAYPLNPPAEILFMDTAAFLDCLSTDLSEPECFSSYHKMMSADKQTVNFYSFSGRRIEYEDQLCWLVEVLQLHPQNLVPDIYQIASARKIMLDIYSQIDHLDTDSDIYEFILDNCRKAVAHSDFCSLILVNGQTARIVAQRGFNQDVCYVDIALNDTFLGQETDGKFDHIAIINDLDKFNDRYHLEFKPGKDNKYLASTISAPIYIEHSLYAILNFDSTQKNTFTEADKELLYIIKSNIEIILTNHQMYTEIRRLSQTDILTGLYNRTYLQEYIRLHREQAFYMGLFDMNDMKHINDIHGHRSGDMALKHFVSFLQRSFPFPSALFRIGGDEFLCITFDLDKARINDCVKSMRRLFEQNPILLQDGAETVLTFSCGFSLHEPNMSSHEVMHRADKAMYQEKRAYKLLHFTK